MKKISLAVLSLGLLAACTGYDYYKTDVRYYQDGEDCIYYSNERGKRFDSDIRALRDGNRIVYRNTRCSDLYQKDTFGYSERNDRRAIVPTSTIEETPAPSCGCATSSCGCSKCGNKKTFLKNKYVIIPA